MQLFFIDESGTIPPQSKSNDVECFVLGGIIIPEDLWHEIDKELTQLKNKYIVIGEIKWRNFSPQKPGSQAHPLTHLNADKKEEFRENLYAILKRFKSVRSICAVVNVKKAYELAYINNQNDLYCYAYKQMTERFQYYLQDLTRTVGSRINGIIICDHRQPNDDQQLRHLHQELLTGGKMHVSKYKNLIEGVFIAPSHLSVGIQFADLVGGAVFRKYARNDSRYFDIIKPLLRKSESGKIEGYGLIFAPKGK